MTGHAGGKKQAADTNGQAVRSRRAVKDGTKKDAPSHFRKRTRPSSAYMQAIKAHRQTCKRRKLFSYNVEFNVSGNVFVQTH
ncbi:hypothetical protein GCM10009794_04360 [Rothia terrae]